MAGRVIQGFFIGGRMQPAPGVMVVAPIQRSTGAPGRCGPPPPAFAAGGAVAQRQAAPGRPGVAPHAFVPHSTSAPRRVGPPPPAFAAGGAIAQRQSAPHAPVQALGGAESFAIDPVRVGLGQGRGEPLPAGLLAKMESAFGADFSAVRVHVGPQAARIGAVAFTTGNDLYFAPGRFQPGSVQGRQLIGHELAHVVQQRQGRVRAPSSGVAVVQNFMLEAEADRLGMRAATLSTRSDQNGLSTPPSSPLQRKACSSPGQDGRASTVTNSLEGPTGSDVPIQRMTNFLYKNPNQISGAEIISDMVHKRNMHSKTNRDIVAHLCGWIDHHDAVKYQCGTCNHHVAYSKIADAVRDKLKNLTLDQAVSWLINLKLLPGENVAVESKFFHPKNQDQALGAMPKVNIGYVKQTNGQNFFDPTDVAAEVDDLIYNLANDPRNMFYWPKNSQSGGSTGLDNPVDEYNHTKLSKITKRLSAYRGFLLGLGLNV